MTHSPMLQASIPGTEPVGFAVRASGCIDLERDPYGM